MTTTGVLIDTGLDSLDSFHQDYTSDDMSLYVTNYDLYKDGYDFVNDFVESEDEFSDEEIDYKKYNEGDINDTVSDINDTVNTTEKNQYFTQYCIDTSLDDLIDNNIEKFFNTPEIIAQREIRVQAFLLRKQRRSWINVIHNEHKRNLYGCRRPKTFEELYNCIDDIWVCPPKNLEHAKLSSTFTYIMYEPVHIKLDETSVVPENKKPLFVIGSDSMWLDEINIIPACVLLRQVLKRLSEEELEYRHNPIIEPRGMKRDSSWVNMILNSFITSVERGIKKFTRQQLDDIEDSLAFDICFRNEYVNDNDLLLWYLRIVNLSIEEDTALAQEFMSFVYRSKKIPILKVLGKTSLKKDMIGHMNSQKKTFAGWKGMVEKALNDLEYHKKLILGRTDTERTDQ